ncbi:TetR/AcrR family transcriptional regulator [Zavarzinia aquatilis]|nr:TetR/AcrR family transcriptional regulator [Zavarzinia aquatilis]
MKTDAERTAPRGRPRKGKGREERTLALRQAIIESAIKEFAAKGYAGASLRMIAGRTGIELGHLGYHFATKLELWQAAAAALFDVMPAPGDLPPATSAAEASANIIRLIGDYASFCVSHPEHIQIVFSESPMGGERLDWLADNYLNAIVAGIALHLDAAHRFGVLREIPASIFIAAMVGISAINFALPPLRDILLRGGLDLGPMQDLLLRFLPPGPPATD